MIQIKIEIIKSHDMWDEDCGGWYDLYKVDDYFIYPLSDWWENDPIPKEIWDKFKETLNGSKSNYDDMIKSLYWDLMLSLSDVDQTFEDWSFQNQCVDWMEYRMYDKLGVKIKVVDHDKRYEDSIKFKRGVSK